jgi:ParB-like chromosome segregation protein Spo0J
MLQPRDRIKAIRVVQADELIANPSNWRRHPPEQRQELTTLLETIGNVDVLKVVDTEDGYLIVDGHLRADILGTARVKVAVLDLDETETKQVLASYDRVGAMAVTDDEALAALLQDIADAEVALPDTDAVQQLADALSQPEPEWSEGDQQTAQDVATRVAGHLQRMADTDPGAIAGAQAIILPTDGHCEALVLADPDLHDIIAELRTMAAAGEPHPLDKLFGAIWTAQQPKQ